MRKKSTHSLGRGKADRILMASSHDSDDVPTTDDDLDGTGHSHDEDKRLNPSSKKIFQFVRKLFSPFGADSDIVVVAYAMYEFASRVSTFNFNILSPLLIADLGDVAFSDHAGKIIWGYVTSTAAILTVFAYLSLTPLIEFGNLKRDTLIGCSSCCAILHILYIFCFFSKAIYLAIPLMILSKISLRVSDVAFSALLDVVSMGKDPHQISSRCHITGYIGMLAFLLVCGLILAIINTFFSFSKILIQGTIPIFLIGCWYLIFIRIIDQMLPPNLGDGLPMPKDISSGTGFLASLYSGLKIGLREQLGNLSHVSRFKDLSMFMLSFVFLQGAANTAVSVAAIFTVEILHLPVGYVATSMLIGLASAIFGLGVYNYLNRMRILTAKQVLLLNMTVLAASMAFTAYVDSATDIYILAMVCGSQIGTVSAYSRSIISSLVPKTRQSRLFSFYEFTQDGTCWVGPMAISTLTGIYGDAYYRRFIVTVCLAEFLIGIPILAYVDVPRGETLRGQIDASDEALGVSVSPQHSTMSRADSGPDLPVNNSTSISTVKSPVHGGH